MQTNQSRLITVSYIFLGGYALIVQTVCIRELLVIFYGNELCLGIVFACWLLGVAIGAGIAARFVSRIRQPILIYGLLLILLCLIFPIQIYGIRLLRSFLHVASGEFIPFSQIWIGTLCALPPFSGIIGAIFPIASSLFPNADTLQIRRVYITEALGSAVGGAIFTFCLVAQFHAFQIAALLGCIGLLIAALLLHDRRHNFRCISLIALLCSGCYASAFCSSLADTLHENSLKARWQSMYRDIPFAASVDSQYGNLALGVQAGQYMLFSDGQYVAAFPDEYQAAMDAHFYLTEHPNPTSVLLIGGGAEGLIGEILKHPIERLDYLELDPKLLTLLTAYLPEDAKRALRDPRVSVIYADGRHYVKQTPRRYDLVILNLPDPINARINRFYTLEFFQEVQRVLNRGGVVVAKISASLHLQEDAANYTGSIYKTLRTVFSQVLVTPGVTNTYFATDQPDVITFDPAILGQRYTERQIRSNYFSAYHYATLLEPEQIRFIESTLRDKLPRFRLNTDFQPITYFYSLLLWARFSEQTAARQDEPLTARLFRLLSHLSLWHLLAMLLGYVLLRLAYDYFKRPKNSSIAFTCLWTIGAAGFAGIALELILMFAFQNLYGCMYQQTGFIIAMFMAGLAIGGYASHRLFTNALVLSRVRYYAMAIAVFAAMLPGCIRVLSAISALRIVDVVFMLLVGISGCLTGGAFPLASSLYAHTREQIGKTAGMIDSADHLGAFFGAMLVGIVCMPLLGITASCVFVSALNLSSAVFLLREQHRSR